MNKVAQEQKWSRVHHESGSRTMTLLSIALGLVMVAADAGSSVAESAPAAVRRYHEIERDMTDALRSEARAATSAARAAAVRKMCAVYRELATDSRLEGSDALRSYKAKLWSRMTRIQRELEQRVARQSGSATGRASSEAESLTRRDVAAGLTADLSYSQHTLGGPGDVLEHNGGAYGGGAVNDHAQELIDLIQRTISPNSWDVNGGLGSMFYYRRLMALVVRATSEAHGDVGGLLEALRRAGN
jgi:hypothetical protein